MDETAPTITARKVRWLWRACWLLLLLLTGIGLYLVATARPAFYSPPDEVRKTGDYTQKLNPPRLNAIGTNLSPLAALKTTITTNQGEIRIEYLKTDSKTVDTLGFTLHPLKGADVARAGESSVRLRRIGYAWAPPGSHMKQIYSVGIPADFFDGDLKPLTLAEVQRDLTNQWDRTVDASLNSPGFRFDLEFSSPHWKVLGVGLYDARTHVPLTSGWGGQHLGEHGYKISMRPYIRHSVPVELIVDVALDAGADEEILPQTGSTFTIGPCRYHLVHIAEHVPASNFSYGEGGKQLSVFFPQPAVQQPPLKECAFVFHASPGARQAAFVLEYLDAAGNKLETGGGGSSGSQIVQGVKSELADIKKIRVRKFRSGHRLIFQLPGLPGLPPPPQKMNNLFQVRASRLYFDSDWEQADYVRRITQLEMAHISKPGPPAGTYPRWLTNVTMEDVLKDYAQVNGLQGQLYVDQETLKIEQGAHPWPLQVKERLQKLWEKLHGP
jgi:hypothetical protein